MFLQLISLFISLVHGELRENILPFEPTFVRFNGYNVEVDHQGSVTELVKKSGEESGQQFTLALNTTNRGIFSRICNLNEVEMKKVEILAMKYSKNGSEPIDITRLYTDAEAYTGQDSWDYRDIFTPIPDSTNISCRVQSIRGVKEVQIRVKDEILTPFEIEFTAEKWTLASETKIYFWLVGILPPLFAFLVCYIKGWFFCESLKNYQCCLRRQKALQEKLKAGEATKLDKIQRWVMMILFNFDLITDFQYVFTVPFHSVWMQSISILTLSLPIVIILLPSFCVMLYGGILILIMWKNKEDDKQKQNQIYQEYIRKYAYFAFLALFNGIQFLDKSLQERFEGNYQFQRNRIQEREKEIDEEILKIDSVKLKKSLHKNIIKQFKEYYPDDLTAIKDLQEDYTIFMRAWLLLSEKQKGHRIKNDNIVDFFNRISDEKLEIQQIDEDAKRLKALEIKNQDFGAKKQLQSNYAFHEKANRVLGEGVMGKIYYSQLKNDKEFEVAIQVVDKKKHANNIDDFNETFKAMRNLDHPNIAKYYESYEDDHNLYYVMEYFDKYKDIQNKINAPEGDEANDNDDDNQDENSNQREQMAQKLIKQLLSAINHMHSENLSHKDIRPENILMNKDDTLKIVDVMLFRSTDAPQKKDEDPYYTSPDDLKTNNAFVDKKSDVWAIGVILYNLLSGQQPFEGEDNQEIENNIINQSVNFDYNEFMNISENAKELVTKMLDKDSSQRITAEEALSHPWFNKDDDQQMNLEMQALTYKTLMMLKKFKKRSMLKQMALFQLVDHLKQQNIVEEIQKLEQVFDKIDINNTTKITEKELEEAYNEMSIKTTSDKIKMIIQEVDYMHNGFITLTEFVCSTLDVSKLSETQEGHQILTKIFNKFQQSTIKQKYITSEDIVFAWNNLGADYIITQHDQDQIFQQHDLARDNVVSLEEFHTIFQDTASKDIGKEIKNFMDTIKRLHGGQETDQRIIKRKQALQIEQTIKFEHDDGYIYYSEFIYKIFLYKYDKLQSNIFQIKADSLFVQEENFDDLIEKKVEERFLEEAEKNTDPQTPALQKSQVKRQLNKNASAEHMINTESIKGLESHKEDRALIQVKEKMDKNKGLEIKTKNSDEDIHYSKSLPQDEGLEMVPTTAKKFGFHNKVMSYVEKADRKLSFSYSNNQQVEQEQRNKRIIIMNKIFGLDVEVQLAQKQDTFMYFQNLKGIKLTKQEVENQFIDNDLRQVLETRLLIDQNTVVSLEQFVELTKIQNKRYSRMIEFEFTYPAQKIEKKYGWLKELSLTYGNDDVTVEVIKEYQVEKAKPYLHDIDQEEKDDEGQDDESKPFLQQNTAIDISQVNYIFERMLDFRLLHYRKQIIQMRLGLVDVKNSRIGAVGDILKPNFQNSAQKQRQQAILKNKNDPVMKRFNRQLLRQKLTGAHFKQVGINTGDFEICLGDKEALGGASPYIDNSRKNQYFGEKYVDLEDPFMYPDHQMIIARIKSTQNLIVLQFDRQFKKIIDGMICVEASQDDGVKYKYTHSFNNWIGKKKDAQNYYRRRFAFLIEGKRHMCFIQTKAIKEKDEDDRLLEEQIRKEVVERTENQWYQDDKVFKKQASLAKSAVSIAFGILEDIPQLALQTLNSILIGQTMTWIQLLSPMASSISVFIRIYSIGSWDLFPESEDMSSFWEQKCQALCLMTCINMMFMIFCFLPIILIVMQNYFVQEQKQLDWVDENFKTVRICETGLCAKWNIF